MINYQLPRVKPSYARLALEVIDIQDPEFGRNIQEQFHSLKGKILSGAYSYSRAIRESQELIRVKKIVWDRLKAKVDIIVNSNLAAVMPFYSNRHHIFINKMYRGKFSIKDQTHFLETLNEKKGYVDIENAKLGGFFSQYPHKVFMNFEELFRDIEMDAAEATAVFLHEIGHLFDACAYSDRLDTNNQIMMNLAEHIGTKKRETDLTYVYTEIKKVYPKVSEEEIDKLCSDNRMVAGYHWYKYVLIANGLQGISQNEAKPGDHTYDNTSFEAMADNFATRFGYGKELISALDKLGKSHGDINKSLGWITLHQFMVATYYAAIIILGLMCFFSAPISVLGLLSLFVIFSVTYSGAEHNKSYTYDDLKVRYIRIRHQLVEYLKNINLPIEEVEGILASIEFADANIKETYEYRTIIEVVANFIFSSSQNARDTKDEQRLIEDLAHNNFFVKAAQLRVQ